MSRNIYYGLIIKEIFKLLEHIVCVCMYYIYIIA